MTLRQVTYKITMDAGKATEQVSTFTRKVSDADQTLKDVQKSLGSTAKASIEVVGGMEGIKRAARQAATESEQLTKTKSRLNSQLAIQEKQLGKTAQEQKNAILIQQAYNTGCQETIDMVEAECKKLALLEAELLDGAKAKKEMARAAREAQLASDREAKAIHDTKEYYDALKRSIGMTVAQREAEMRISRMGIAQNSAEAKSIRKLAQEYDELRIAQQKQGQGKGIGKNAQIAQNASYQLQDAMVQAQMGTDASVIIAQQAPQFLSALSPAMAVLGTAVAAAAIAFPILSKAMGDTSVSAEELIEIQERLNSSFEETERGALVLSDTLLHVFEGNKYEGMSKLNEILSDAEKLLKENKDSARELGDEFLSLGDKRTGALNQRQARSFAIEYGFTTDGKADTSSINSIYNHLKNDNVEGVRRSINFALEKHGDTISPEIKELSKEINKLADSSVSAEEKVRLMNLAIKSGDPFMFFAKQSVNELTASYEEKGKMLGKTELEQKIYNEQVRTGAIRDAELKKQVAESVTAYYEKEKALQADEAASKKQADALKQLNDLYANEHESLKTSIATLGMTSDEVANYTMELKANELAKKAKVDVDKEELATAMSMRALLSSDAKVKGIDQVLNTHEFKSMTKEEQINTTYTQNLKALDEDDAKSIDAYNKGIIELDQHEERLAKNRERRQGLAAKLEDDLLAAKDVKVAKVKQVKSAYQTLMETYDQEVASLQEQVDTHGMSTDEVNKYIAAKRIEAAEKQMGRVLTEKETKAIYDHVDAQSKLNEQLEANKRFDEIKDNIEVSRDVTVRDNAYVGNYSPFLDAHDSQINETVTHNKNISFIDGQIDMHKDDPKEQEKWNKLKEEEERRHQTAMTDIKREGSMAALDVLIDAYGEESAIGKAAFVAKQAMTVAQIIMDTHASAAAAGGVTTPQGASIMAMGYTNAGIVAALSVAEVAAYDKGGNIPAGGMGIVSEFGDELVGGTLVLNQSGSAVPVTGREKTAQLLKGNLGSYSDEASSNSVTSSSVTNNTVNQTINVNGNGDKALAEAMRKAADEGARRGSEIAYNKVSNDFNTGRGIRATLKKSIGA